LNFTSAKADTIAHRTSRTIQVRMDEDPVFYQRFSEMLQKVIDDFRRKRISENEYLMHVTELMNSVVNRTGDDIPGILEGHEVAKAYYGIVKQSLAEDSLDDSLMNDWLPEIAIAIDEIIERNRIVQWVDNEDVKNRMRTEIEDWLFEYAARKDFELNFEIIDEILDRCMTVAKARRADVN
jgi:type I restriction enzyme R subunit